jgi:ATP-dependent DNA ligase
LSESSLPFSLSPLCRQFVGPKPIETSAGVDLNELERQGRLHIERKRDGHGGLVTSTGLVQPEVCLYTRTGNGTTSHFPTLIEDLRSMNIPADTLLAHEMIVECEGVDSQAAYSSIVKSNPARAIALQKEGRRVQIRFFNVIVHRGKDVIHLPYRDRLDIMEEIVSAHPLPHIGLAEEVRLPFAEATAHSVAQKWEGLVVYDLDAPSEYRLDGRSDQPPRPYGCWKWKKHLEGDFVVYGWVPSTAATRKGMVKDFLIGQYDRQGKLVECGRCSLGLSSKQRQIFTDDSLYPMVAEIQFERRTPKNRLINAQILRLRDDKSPHECVVPD